MRFREASGAQQAVFYAVLALMLLGAGPTLLLVPHAVGEPVTGFVTANGHPRPVYPQTHVARDAGLENYSTALEINGRPITPETEWMWHRANGLTRAIGAENTVRVRTPAGAEVDLTIPAHPYGWSDAATFALPLVFVGLLVYATSIGGFVMRPFTHEGWALLAYGAAVGGTVVTFAPVAYMPWTAAPGTVWDHVWMALDAYEIAGRWYVAAATFHLGLAFPVPARLLSRYRSLPLVLYTVPLPLAVYTILLHPYEVIAPDTALYVAVIVAGATMIVGAVAFLWGRCSWLAVAGQAPIVRQRARLLLLGTIVGFGPLVFTIARQTVAGGVMATPSPSLYYPLLVFPLTLGYMAVRHDLFDAGVAARRGLAYGLCALGAVALIWGAGRVSPVLAALTLLPLLFIWPRVNAQITAMLYPGRAAFPALRRALEDELAAAANPRDVLAILADAPRRVCGTDGAAAFLLPGVEQAEQQLSVSGRLDAGTVGPVTDEPVVQMLVASRQAIRRDQIRFDSQFARIRRQASEWMDRLGASVVLPIERSGEVVGGLVVGREAEGQLYDPAALDLLQEVAREGGRALTVAALREREAAPPTTPAARLFSPPRISPLPVERTASLAPRLSGERYQVVRLLGEGGYKQVYLARDTAFDRDVALALIKRDVLDEHGVRRVQQEARALGSLSDHPNVVTVFDMGEVDSQLYFVSEYLGGGSLTDRLAEAPGRKLPLTEALGIADQLCRALVHVHGKGFVHRDLKPGNIWFTAGGDAKLGDFGLVLPQEQSRITQQGALVGTFAYMAPEQFRGERVTAQTDLYALGVVMYEMFAGRRPFAGETAAALAQAHVNLEPAAPIVHAPELPRPLSDLILALLAKEPHQRPPDAAAVRDQLAACAPTMSAATTRWTFEAPAARGLVRDGFVGRDREFARGRALLAEVMGGHGRLLLVSGEPGIGKTRLARECSLVAEQQSARVLWGRCYEGEGAPAFWPWVRILRTYVQECDIAQLRAELGEGAAHVAQIVPEVSLRLPGVEPSPELAAGAGRFLVFDCVTRFLKRAATRQPLMLILEDVHWADRSSLLLLEFLVRELATTPIFLAATYRDVEVDREHPLAEVLGRLAREPVGERLQLGGLSEDAVAQLIRDQQSGEVDRSLARTVFARTEGNPFFIKETLRHLAETGTATAGELGIPAGVRDVLRLRLGRLSPTATDVLTTAAVAGREFAAAEVEAAGDISSDSLLGALDEAEGAGLIRPGADRERRWRFTHALIRETLYDDLPLPRRTHVHRRIGEALETLHTLDVGPHLPVLAFHFFEGLEAGASVSRALDYNVRAAEQAVAQTAYEDAVAHFERALATQRRQQGPDEALRARLLLRLGQARISAGRPVEALDALFQAVAVARKLALPQPFAEAAFAIGNLRATYAELDEEVVALVDEGLGLVGERDSPERAMLLALRSVCYSLAGTEGARADELSAEALAMARAQDDTQALLHALSSRVELARIAPEDRLGVADEIARVADRTQQPDWLGVGLMRRATANLETLNRPGFDVDTRALVALAERTPLARLRWNADIAQGVAAMLDGDYGQAQKFIDGALVHGRQFREENALQTHFTQRFLLAFVWERLPDIARLVHSAAAGYLYRYGPRISLALLYLAEGRTDDAREEWRRLTTVEFRDLPEDRVAHLWLAGMSEIAIALEDYVRAERLYVLLQPWSALTITMGGGSACLGAAAYWLGLGAAALERWPAAERHFNTALEINTRLASPPLVARTQYALADMLLTRGNPADAKRAVTQLRHAATTAEAHEMHALLSKARDRLAAL